MTNFIERIGKQLMSGMYNIKKFDYVGKFIDGIAMVRLGRCYGFVNEEMKPICPIIFQRVLLFVNGYAAVQFNGRWGVIDKEGIFVCEPMYDWVDDYINGFFMVEQNKKFAFVDPKLRRQICSLKYDEAERFHDRKARVRVGMTWLQINDKGQEI